MGLTLAVDEYVDKFGVKTPICFLDSLPPGLKVRAARCINSFQWS